jgi:hypothetical protein
MFGKLFEKKKKYIYSKDKNTKPEKAKNQYPFE